MKKNKILAVLVTAGIALTFNKDSALAQTFPSKIITIIVPAAPGGASDIIARIISQSFSKLTNQNVVVENRSGANGNLGALSVVRSQPDGHTLLLATTNNLATNQFVMANIGFDPLIDLLPVSLVAEAPELVAISTAFPATTMNEFIEAVQARPGYYNYGSPGTGSVPHLSVERLLRSISSNMVHVPFRGSAAAMVDVAAGNIQMSMATLGSIEPFRVAGTARVLGIAGNKRLRAIPETPTFDEIGLKGLEMSGWWAVMAPKGTSPNTIQFLNDKLRQAFSDPSNIDILEKLGIVSISKPIEYLENFILKEVKLWEKVIKDVGLKPE